MRIYHNIPALDSWRQINQINASLSKTLQRLSSGLRINSAADDAAGLAISEKMRAQINGLNMAVKNAQDAISLVQTAEGALNEVHSILQRMRELAVQASSDTNTDVDRAQIQKEVDQLKEEINRIARTTEFNTKKLLDGSIKPFRSKPVENIVTGGNIGLTSIIDEGDDGKAGTYILEVGQFDTDTTLDVRATLFTVSGSETTSVDITAKSISIGNITIKWSTTDIGVDGSTIPEGTVVDSAVVRVDSAITSDANPLTFQIGANEGQSMFTGIDEMNAAALGLASVDVTTSDKAQRSIMMIDAAIFKVSSTRATLGAVQNRLEHTIANLGVASENLTAAESRIRDADMAKEMMQFTKQQILLQSATSMLAQANAMPQNVLLLMR